MLSGEINGIIVIDIDNIEHWNNLLQKKIKKNQRQLKL
jgi:hypothetical protein